MYVTEYLAILHPKFFFAIWLLLFSFLKNTSVIPGIQYFELSKKQNTNNYF